VRPFAASAYFGACYFLPDANATTPLYISAARKGAHAPEYDILCREIETLRRRCAWSFSIFICAAERRAPSEKVNSAFIFHT